METNIFWCLKFGLESTRVGTARLGTASLERQGWNSRNRNLKLSWNNSKSATQLVLLFRRSKFAIIVALHFLKVIFWMVIPRISAAQNYDGISNSHALFGFPDQWRSNFCIVCRKRPNRLLPFQGSFKALCSQDSNTVLVILLLKQEESYRIKPPPGTTRDMQTVQL